MFSTGVIRGFSTAKQSPRGRSAPTRVFWPFETRQSQRDWLSCGSKKPIGQCDLLETQRLYLWHRSFLLTLGWLGYLNEKGDWWWLQSLVYFSIGYYKLTPSLTGDATDLVDMNFVIGQIGSNLAFSVLTLPEFFKFGAFSEWTKSRPCNSPQFSGFFGSEVLGSKFLRRISLGVDRDGNGRAGEVGRSGEATWGDGGWSFVRPWGMRLEVSFLLAGSFRQSNWRGRCFTA